MASQPVTPLPADNPKRPVKVARPNTEQGLPHIGPVGDTYTILLSGDDTNGRYCLIDMHIPPGGGRLHTATILLSGDDTNGRYCLIDMHIPPGGGPPPHRHDFEEFFTLLIGEIEATCRGEQVTVRAGETLSIPANAPHSFTNASKETVRLLCLCAPAGQEEFFAQVGVPVAGRTTSPPKLEKEAQAAFMKKAEELAPKYRTEFIKPRP